MKRAIQYQQADPHGEAINRLLADLETLSLEAQKYKNQVKKSRVIIVLLFILVML